MTEVAFHVNVADVPAYTCRLLRKAHAKGARVHVTGLPAQVDAVDRGLWLMSQSEFIPHAGVQAPERVRRRSGIVLGGEWFDGAQVLVNLSTDMPSEHGRYARVIEIVGTTEAERSQARQRWKTYRSEGIEPEMVDQAGSKG
ncbi:MAG: DNA polymerase III subunit chi [Hydrogenophaga sp.]|nr:DNA polymerase III subunit chi [Hydrogenophaga sp.]